MNVKDLTFSPQVLMKYMFVALLYSAIFLCAFTPATAEDPEGFISIDCGFDGKYVDPQTKLTWIGDRSYISVGENGKIPSSISLNGEHRALKTFRYFPTTYENWNFGTGGKYCYELATPNYDTAFLIRATFLHGNSPLLDQQLQFSVYINATLWITVQYGFGDAYDLNLMEPVNREGMFINHGGRRVNVCLVPKVGTPFISSLDLRKLDSKGSIYADAFVDNSRWGYGDFLLSNFMRWNVGPNNTSLVRYPNDTYDRFWESRDSLLDILSVSSTSPDFNSSKNISSRNSLKTFNNLPFEVLEDAWSLRGGLNISMNNLPVLESGSLACLIFYTYANESSLRSPVSLTLTIDEKSQDFNVTDQFTMQSIPYSVNANSTSVAFRSPPDRQLELMALEIYSQDKFVTTTNREENLIQYLRKIWKMSNWSGDPCNPEPYDGIDCFSDSEIDQNIFYIYALQLSNLENKSFVIPSNSSAALDLPLQLDQLGITNSSLDDDTVHYLLSTFTNSSSLGYLDLSHNNIRDFFHAPSWDLTTPNLFQSLKSLDLSHNHLTTVPSREDFNVLFTEQSWLQALSISNNNITGAFPDGLLQYLSNFPYFSYIDISNNNITGEVSGNFLQYWSNSTNSISLISDNNTISGKLNLSTWYQALLRMAQNSTNGSEPMFSQSFSFVNNDILDIVPSAEDFEESAGNITLFMSYFQYYADNYYAYDYSYNSPYGIALGGNPYCKSVKTTFQSFLCRSSTTSGYGNVIAGKRKIQIPIVPIIGGVLGGNLILIGGLAIFTIIWRLRKQVVILREFQQELLNRNVKPPFFQYQELKIATNDFHFDNKLGSGAFGAVYKGSLQNRTEVAVKKLFNYSQQAQVLSDFLNEVVLLTGIKHKNLVQLLGCCINDNERILVYEFAERGNVADALWGICYSPKPHNLYGFWLFCKFVPVGQG